MTIERFNGFAETGKDLDFQRGEQPIDNHFHGPSDNNHMAQLTTSGPFYAFIIAALALALVPTILVGALVNFGPGDEGPLEVLLFFIGGLVQVFALILGILAVTTEFRLH